MARRTIILVRNKLRHIKVNFDMDGFILRTLFIALFISILGYLFNTFSILLNISKILKLMKEMAIEMMMT